MIDETIVGYQTRISALETELDEMTGALAQAWDQLVPFLQAAPERANSLRDIVPVLEGIMAAVDAEIGAIYLVPENSPTAEWFTIPSNAISHSVLQQHFDALATNLHPYYVNHVPTWNGKPANWMLMPILVNNQPVGAIGVGISEGAREFNAFDARTLMRMTERVAGQIVASDLVASQAREEKLAQELQIAGLIQRSIQPGRSPDLPGLQVSASWEPAANVGGDAWGWVLQPSGRLACFLLDVAGKGLPAALAAVSLHTALKMALKLDLSPVETIRAANEEVYESYTETDILTTVVVARIDPGSGLLEQANAGHPPTLVRTAGRWLTWEATAPPLGVLPELAPQKQQVVLQPGDLAVFYSDGFSEIESEHGMWKTQGLLNAMTDQPPLNAEQAIQRILRSAADLQANRPAHDDQTLVAIHRTEVVEYALGQQLTVDAAFPALVALEGFVEEMLAGQPQTLCTRIKLAVHELCVNIIQHGYDRAPGQIQLEAFVHQHRLTLTVRDEAPNTYSAIEVTPPNPADLPESGWGMFIVLQVMDELHYQRLSSGNLWRMSILLPAEDLSQGQD